MASGTSTWRISEFISKREESHGGACLYGPQFRVGTFLFQLHLHPLRNAWPEPGSLYLRLLAEAGAKYADSLKIRVTFKVRELDYKTSLLVKDTPARWQGGFGPKEPQALGEAIASFGGDVVTIEVSVEILEVMAPKETTFRWPFESFEELRNTYAFQPSKAAFCSRLSRRFTVQDPDFGVLTFRCDLHPFIDATGNFYVSFKLERADKQVFTLEVEYELVLEELGVSQQSQRLQGHCEAWARALGLAGQPTVCDALRAYTGPFTLRLHVNIKSCDVAEDVGDPPVWSDFISPQFRYLLLSAAGPLVPGMAEPLDGGDPDDTFATGSAWNVEQLRTFLVAHGVPAANLMTINYDGESEQQHPREAIEAFLEAPGLASKMVVYFSGHANFDDGAWCFGWKPQGQKYAASFVVPPHELFRWRSAMPTNISRVPLELIVESVAAGAWCVAAKEAQLQGRILAACAPGRRAWSHCNGSIFTEWLVGRGRELQAGQQPNGPQVPWEYTRLGTAGPMSLFRPRSITAPQDPTRTPRPRPPAEAMASTMPARLLEGSLRPTSRPTSRPAGPSVFGETLPLSGTWHAGSTVSPAATLGPHSAQPLTASPKNRRLLYSH